MRGATPLVDFGLDLVNNFNPRAPCGARPHPARRCPAQATFQPTRPLRGATGLDRVTPTPHRISTHAPLAGRDDAQVCDLAEGGVFQPTRPLRGATRHTPSWRPPRRSIFQPTRPLRGATLGASFCGKDTRFQPTRPLRGATSRRRDRGQRTIISTHAPLAGRDCKGLCQAPSHYPFQPTRPLRGATFSPRSGEKMDRYFNPRAPCGARLRQRPHPQAGNDISTHAPLAGRDEHRVDHLVRQLDFNPRAPCGARRCVVASNSAYADFNPRAPCGARRGHCAGICPRRDFNPRAPCGARPRLK